MKVLLTIENGFSKTLFEGERDEVMSFVKGFDFCREKNLSSPEAIAVLNYMNTLGDTPAYINWSNGALAALANTKGNLEVRQ